MVRTRSFLAGLVFSMLLFGCAGFTYHYYGLDGADYREGKLLGPKPENDLPFSRCAPTAAEKRPCVVMLTPDFKAFRLDYEDTKQKLKECQSGKEQLEVSTP